MSSQISSSFQLAVRAANEDAPLFDQPRLTAYRNHALCAELSEDITSMPIIAKSEQTGTWQFLQ